MRGLFLQVRNLRENVSSDHAAAARGTGAKSNGGSPSIYTTYACPKDCATAISRAALSLRIDRTMAFAASIQSETGC